MLERKERKPQEKKFMCVSYTTKELYELKILLLPQVTLMPQSVILIDNLFN